MTRQQRRACGTCGARLAADNQHGICSPCARQAATEDTTAPTMPTEFWDDPGLKRALAERHFGQVIRAYRLARNREVTQAQVARWLGVSQVQVSRIESGKSLVNDLIKLDRWAKALRIPERCLWFSLSAQSSDVPSPGPSIPILRSATNGGRGGVRRRQFIKVAGTGAVTAGSSLLTAPPPRASPAVSRYTVGNHDVELLREATQTFRRLDNRYGGGHGRSPVTAYMKSIVEPLLKDGRARSEVKDDLYCAAAELYQLAGWMAYDIGQVNEGRQHLRRALRLCNDAGNDGLYAEMLAGMSHHAAFLGSAEAAVDLALAAQQSAKNTGIPALRAEVAVMEAHGLALLGEKKDCLTALHEAERAFTGFSTADTPAWLSYFDGAYLAAKFAHSFRDLGRPNEAEQFARRSLDMSDGYERGRLFNTALLASTLADQRRIDEACEFGTSAVEMTGTVRSVRSVSYLADLSRRLAPFRAEAAVKRLYDRMTDVGVALYQT
jgi:transcriptional regulator with XRE-family HTH domain